MMWQRRWSMVEYQRRALMRLMALHGANARISAARLLDRDQAHVLEALAWALDSPAPPAVHEYAAIIWHSMPLLQPRLDASQRQALCEAGPSRTLAAPSLQHTWCNANLLESCSPEKRPLRNVLSGICMHGPDTEVQKSCLRQVPPTYLWTVVPAMSAME